MKKNVIKKIIILSLAIFNVFSMNAYATMRANKADEGEERSQTPPTTNNASSSGESYDEGEEPIPVIVYGTEEHPKKIYCYTSPSSGIKNALQNMEVGTEVYSTPDRATFTFQTTYSDTIGTQDVIIKQWNKTLSPTVYIKKTVNYNIMETNRITDYYVWECTGPEAWGPIKDDIELDWTATKVGKHLISAYPHQIVTDKKWTTYNYEAYDVFPDGTTSGIVSWSADVNIREETKQVDRKDVIRYWEQDLVPIEVGQNIKINYNEDYSKTLPGPVEIDTQLIY